MNDEQIVAKDLTKIYRRGSEDIYALKKASFAITEGEFAVIVGPSGSGKTTLLNLLGCLDTPTRGSLRLNGIEVSGRKEKELVRLRRENIGFVFQQFLLLPTLTVRENIALPLLFRKKNDGTGKVDEVIRLIGLDARAEHLPNQLSGGEMQRVAIGRALITNPRIILADEPTGNLDSVTARTIFDLFQGLNGQGLTVLVVTHNVELAKSTHKIIFMADGQIVHPEAD